MDFRKPTVDFSVDDIRFTSDPCSTCGTTPTEADALRALETLRHLENSCAACGKPFVVVSLTLTHQHDPAHSSDGIWRHGITCFRDVIVLQGVQDYSLWCHGGCVARAFPFLPDRQRNRRIESLRQGFLSIQDGVADRWTTEPLEPTRRDNATLFVGDFHTELNSDGILIVPKAWASGELELRAFTSPVKGECCVRIYEKSAWARTLVALRAYGTPEPNDLRSLEISRDGRLVLPRDLLTKIGVRDKVYVSGMVDFFEIWNPVAWAEVISGPVTGPTLWDHIEKRA